LNSNKVELSGLATGMYSVLVFTSENQVADRLLVQFIGE
jgi:hypothetical protein